MSHIKQSGIFYFSYVTLNFHLREIEQVGKDFFFTIHIAPDTLFICPHFIVATKLPAIHFSCCARVLKSHSIASKQRVSFFIAANQCLRIINI